MLMQLHLALSEECLLPDVIGYHAKMVMQLHPEPRVKKVSRYNWLSYKDATVFKSGIKCEECRLPDETGYPWQVLKAEGLEKYADVKSVTSELASAMDLTPEELEHVASELIDIASQRGIVVFFPGYQI